MQYSLNQMVLNVKSGAISKNRRRGPTEIENEPYIGDASREGVNGSRKSTKDESHREDRVNLAELKCMLLNAESLANKMDEFRARVAEINPDIIGVTETWAKEVQSDQWYALNGYHCVRCDNEEEMKGGVMIYFKENLKVSVCDELNRSKCRDSLWVWVTIGEEKFIAGVCIGRELRPKVITRCLRMV